MTEYIVTTADNDYIMESDEPAMRLVYQDDYNESDSVLPLAMMRELLADLDNAIEQGEGSKFKVRIDVERYEPAARTTEHDKNR
jgi:hypothetical protein